METKIGIGVMVFKDGKVLMARRKGSHGQGEYAFPGGHLEYMKDSKNVPAGRSEKNAA
jgi:8-oxo-dGTP diphosphatase